MADKKKKLDLTDGFDYSIVDRAGVATSPFAEFPGRVVLPVFTLPVFTKWRELIAAAKNNDTPQYVFYSDVSAPVDAPTDATQESDDTKAEPADETVIRWINVKDALLCVELAKEISVENLEDGWRSAPLDTLPYIVLVWLAMAVNEWANRQVTFRRPIA